MDKIIDLKNEEFFIPQYVDLRNSYVDLLLTLPVNINNTREWLKKTEIEVRGIVRDNILFGAAILYLDKGGEIAFFVREQNKGFGGRLLNAIEMVAIERGLKSVWAWVLDYNYIAQKVFEKNGYIREKIAPQKVYNKKNCRGVIFRKRLRK